MSYRVQKFFFSALFTFVLFITNGYSQLNKPTYLDSLTVGAESIRDFPTLNLFLLKEQASIQGPGLNIISDEMKIYYDRMPQDQKAQQFTHAGTSSLAKLVIDHKSIEIPKDYYWFSIDLKTLEYRFLMKE